MFDKLAARLRDSDTDYRLLVPLLASTLLVQMVTSLVRVTISYRAVELQPVDRLARPDRRHLRHLSRS